MTLTFIHSQLYEKVQISGFVFLQMFPDSSGDG